jgi:Zn-finger nucleic acid-binding protein
MEVEDFEIVQLELKYCEYCGGLWLRPKGELEVYCANCVLYMARCSDPRGRKTRPRLPINTDLAIEGQSHEIVVCGKGGNA